MPPNGNNPKKGQDDFSAKAIGQLGWPSFALVAKHRTKLDADAFGLVAQAVAQHEASREVNPFLIGKLHRALKSVRAIWTDLPQEDPDKTNWKQWREAVRNSAVTRDLLNAALAELPRQRLEYLVKVAGFEDRTSLESGDAEELDCLACLKEAPADDLLAKSEAAWLVMGWPLAQGTSDRAVRRAAVSLLLKRSSGGGWLPAPNAGLNLKRDLFFDRDSDEPLGNWTAEAFAQACSEPWRYGGTQDEGEGDKRAALLDRSPSTAADVNLQEAGTSPETNASERADSPQSWIEMMSGLQQCMQRLTGCDRLIDLPSVLGRRGLNGKVLTIWLKDQPNNDPAPFTALLQSMANAEVGCAASQMLTPVVTPNTAVLDPLDVGVQGMMDSHKGEGQKREVFPLDPTQRLAAQCAMGLRAEREQAVLAVNGPPGTGKTTFLRAVLASHWVQAALDENPFPRTVLATAATNKAVTNIIDAFAGCISPDTEPLRLESRWLPGLPTYGWLFPSAQAATDYPNHMHLVWGPSNPMSISGAAKPFAEANLNELEEHYLRSARCVLEVPAEACLMVAGVASRLQRELTQLTESVSQRRVELQAGLAQLRQRRKALRESRQQALVARATLERCQRELLPLYKRTEQLQQLLIQAELVSQETRRLLKGWRNRLPAFVMRWLFGKELDVLAQASLSLTQSLEAFDGGRYAWSNNVIQQQGLVQALHQRLGQEQRQAQALSEQIAVSEPVQQRFGEVQTSVRKAFQALVRCLDSGLTDQRKCRRRMLVAAAPSAGAFVHSKAEDLLRELEEVLDVTVRVRCFHLAARYWEARWLMQARIDQEDQNQRPPNLGDRLKRLAMLGVALVATTHKLARMRRPNGGEPWRADLLLMDEAGQCMPHVAVAMADLADTAVVVGDVHQLTPISPINRKMSLHMAEEAQLDTSSPKQGLSDALCASRGSAMRLALDATAIWQVGSDGADAIRSGVMLGVHYRCHPIIAGFCNELMYGNAMKMARKNTPMKRPPMAWVDVMGRPTRLGSSWANSAEAEAIATWLEREGPGLEREYGKPLDEVVAVLTPLKAQFDELKRLLERGLAARLGEGGKETVERLLKSSGTVHRLQGAERPVVLFSLVQTRSNSGSLMVDRDAGNLLNVAASRAKDLFVVFGERATLRPAPVDGPWPDRSEQLPLGRLGAYMRRCGARLYPRHLVVIEAPGKVAGFKAALGGASGTPIGAESSKAPAIETALGAQAAILATGGSFMRSELDEDGTLIWKPIEQKDYDRLKDEMAQHRGLLDSLVIATDDDQAGERIGWHVADLARLVLGSDIAIKRMRFNSVEAEELQQSFALAGPRFDPNLLGAALLSDLMRHWDEALQRRIDPASRPISLPERSVLALAVDMAQDRGMHHQVDLNHPDSDETLRGFLTPNRSSMDMPQLADMAQAETLEGNDLSGVLAQAWPSMQQQAPFYPPSTTHRILQLAADELGLLPWDAQELLNGLYLSGEHRT
jgi:hypothetical protein